MMGSYDVLADVRGRGLMIGLEFGRPSSLRARARWSALRAARVGLFAQMIVVALFQRHRILTQVSGDHMEVIKLIPPLMIGEGEVKLFTEALGEVLGVRPDAGQAGRPQLTPGPPAPQSRRPAGGAGSCCARPSHRLMLLKQSWRRRGGR
jgi:hypothetical protein